MWDKVLQKDGVTNKVVPLEKRIRGRIQGSNNKCSKGNYVNKIEELLLAELSPMEGGGHIH